MALVAVTGSQPATPPQQPAQADAEEDAAQADAEEDKREYDIPSVVSGTTTPPLPPSDDEAAERDLLRSPEPSG